MEAAHRTYDPEIDIDWTGPVVPDSAFLSEHLVSLFGTRLWGRLTTEQRRDLAKAEAVELFGLALVSKALVSHLLVRTAADQECESDELRRTLTELGANARHLVMFARTLSALDATDRALRPLWLRRALPFAELVAARPGTWAVILMVNELLVGVGEELMDDEDVQPMLRMVSKVHVADQSRHLAHARSELLRTSGEMGLLERAITQQVLGAGALALRYVRIRPRAYRAAGISPIAGWLVGQGNPVAHEVMARCAEGLVPALEEARLIEGPLLRALWRHAGLARRAA